MIRSRVPGSKSRAQEVEDTHPLLFAQGVKSAMMSMPAGFNLTKEFLAEKVQTHNSSTTGASKIGSQKLQATLTLVMHTPDDVFNIWMDQYHKRTWDKMVLNSRLCGLSMWRVGEKDTIAKGQWASVYTNNEESVRLTQKFCLKHWDELCPLDGLEERSPSSVAKLRPADSDFEKWNLRMRLFVNWVTPQILTQYGTSSAVQKAEDWLFQGTLDEEFDQLILARSEASVYPSVSLHSIPVLRRLLEGQTARVGEEEKTAESNQQLLQDFGKLKDTFEEDAVRFEGAIQSFVAEQGQQLIRELAAARGLDAEGKSVMTNSASKHTFKITRAGELEKVKLQLDMFLAAVKDDVGTSAAMPILHFWNQNVGGAEVENKSNWGSIVNGVKSCMQGHADCSIFVMLSKTYCKKARSLLLRSAHCFRESWHRSHKYDLVALQKVAC